MRVRLLLAACLLSLCAPKARALAPEADRLVLEGLDALYGLDFAQAEERFRSADKLEPESPAGPFFLAGLYWVQFSQNADLPGTAAQLEPRFNEELGRALKRAQARVKADPKSAEAEFYLGSVYGMRGRWQILKRQWIRSALNGLKGYRHLQKCVALDPGWEDAYLGLGMYDYYSATLPAALKLASLVIEKGDKARGLRYAERTIEKGHFGRTEARLFLIGVYTGYEHKPELAIELARGLRREKPDNAFFTLLELIARIDSKDWTGAIGIGEELAPLARRLPYAAPQASLFDLYLGEAYLGARSLEAAQAVFERCVGQAPDPRKGAVTYCRLRLAQALDLLGRRDEAVKLYRQVKGEEDFFDSYEKAKLGLKKPATPELVEAQLVE